MDCAYDILIKHCQSGNITVIKALIKDGACVNCADNNGVSPLQITAASGKEDVTSFLLMNGAEINKSNNMGWTPVMHAARNGHLTVLKILIESGADINLKNRLGSDLLSLAAASGSQLLVGTLLETLTTEALLSSLQQNTVSPVIMAVLFGHSFVVQSLIHSGFDINESLNYSGVTALMMAAAGGYTSVANLLLEHGADPDLTNSLQHTALDIAMAKGYTNMSDILQSKTKITSIAKASFFESPNIDTNISSHYGWSVLSYHQNTERPVDIFPPGCKTNLLSTGSCFPHSPGMRSPSAYSHCSSVVLITSRSSSSSGSYATPNSSPDRSDTLFKKQIFHSTVPQMNLQNQNLHCYSSCSFYHISESPVHLHTPIRQQCPIPVPPISPYKDIPFSYNLTPQSFKCHSGLCDRHVSQESCSSPLHLVTPVTINNKCLNSKRSSPVNKQCSHSHPTSLDRNQIKNKNPKVGLKCWWNKQIARRFRNLVRGKDKCSSYVTTEVMCRAEETSQQDFIKSDKKTTITIHVKSPVKNEILHYDQPSECSTTELKPERQYDSERFHKLLLEIVAHSKESLTPEFNAKQDAKWKAYIPVLLKHEIDIQTFLTLSKSDLEEMGIQNPDVQNDLLQVINVLKQDTIVE